MRSAIMDVGFNAIRAVIYEDDAIGAPEIFNSKFKNDILSLLENEHFDIKHQTYLTIKYFLHIFKKLEVTKIKCVATAVLRNHPKATAFVEFIRNKYQINIEIISGEEEARLTALGLILGINQVTGIAADLGGGSLELATINNSQIGHVASLELGTHIISDQGLTDIKIISRLIEKIYGSPTCQNLYLIGGGLRFIGRLYMEYINYPIRNLHNLTIPVKDFLDYLAKANNFANYHQNEANRRVISASASLVAKAMIKIFKPKMIILSTYGLKEGVRLNYLGQEKTKYDLVLEKIKYNCNYNLAKTDFSEYFAILLPLIRQNIVNIQRTDQEIARLLQLAIMLSKLKYSYNNSFDPNILSSLILTSEIPFTHRERIELSLILTYSTIFKPSLYLIKLSKKMISKKDHDFCQIIGHFLYITEAIDGSNFTSPSFSISLENDFLEINSADILPRTIFEKICLRLKSIAYCRKNLAE